MIDKLRSMAIFATVVDQGTFRGAARQLGLSPSRISQTISDLEKSLGVTLLYRSTRQLSLTNEGGVLYDKVCSMLIAAESGLDAISPMSTEPAGTLRITAPAFVTQTEIMEAFAQFAKDYPNVSLNFYFSDQSVDLIKDGFDVAIRAGWLEDSDHLTRNLGHADRLLVASAEYVAGRPTPTHARDLESWDWVRFVVRPGQTELTSPKGEAVSLQGRSSIKVNSADALYEFAVRGMGLTAIPEHMARRGLDRGELVHVLPEWKLRPLGLHAVWPNQSRRENLTILFVRFLADALGPESRRLPNFTGSAKGGGISETPAQRDAP